MSKIPYFLISLAFGAYTFVTRAAEGHDIEATSAAFSVADRFFMVCQTLLFYPVKLLVPLGYSVAYPFVKEGGAWPWPYYVAPVAVAGLAALIWWKGRHLRDVLLGVALYLLPLSVMLPFRTVGSFELRSDRYVYLSCLGLFLLAGLAIERLQPAVRTAVLAGAVAILGFLAMRQTAVWKDGIALFKNCVDKTPESSLCQCNLAYSELISLNFNGAVQHYSEALRYDPNTVEAYNGRGQAYFHLRQIPQALDDFTKAIEAGISTPKLFLNRGKCLVMLNRPAEALPDLSRSLELEPKAFETFFFRAVAREKSGEPEGAIQDYTEAIKLKPDYLEALVNRGLLLVNTGRPADAVADYSAAVRLNPNLAMAWNNRANAYMQLGDLERALADAEQAVRVDPNYLRGYQTRGTIRLRLGQTAAGQADLARAAGR